MTFGQRLRANLDERGPLCVGIDPHPELLAAWGLNDDVAGLERFALTVVEAFADRLAMLKPQSAFFERHGSRGIAVLERVLGEIGSAGALSLLDAKRGDVGSTMRAYAEAYVGADPAVPADAITVSPYLGFESLRPVLDAARRNGRGVFVLALTSNSEAVQVQRATVGGESVGASMLRAVAAENEGEQPMGSVGAVVGATIEGADADLASVNGPLLAPGLGAQGGDVAGLHRIFGEALPNVIPSTSRDVLGYGPEVVALRDAAARALDL